MSQMEKTGSFYCAVIVAVRRANLTVILDLNPFRWTSDISADGENLIVCNG